MEIFSSTTKTAAMTAAKHLRLKARIKQNVTDNTDPEILCAKLYTVKVQVKILGVWVTVWAETCDYSDGKTNTITTVQKDNLIIQLNPSKESHGAQPYQQNRVYHPDGKTPALMQGTGGRTINTITDAGGGDISEYVA